MFYKVLFDRIFTGKGVERFVMKYHRQKTGFQCYGAMSQKNGNCQKIFTLARSWELGEV